MTTGDIICAGGRRGEGRLDQGVASGLERGRRILGHYTSADHCRWDALEEGSCKQVVAHFISLHCFLYYQTDIIRYYIRYYTDILYYHILLSLLP